MKQTNSEESLRALLRLLIDELVDGLSQSGKGCASLLGKADEEKKTRQTLLGMRRGHDVDIAVNFLPQRTIHKNSDSSRCPPAFLLPVENKAPNGSAWRSPPWAHICMTGQLRKRRSPVSYGLETAILSRQSNEAVAGKPLSTFQTPKKKVRSATSMAAAYGASNPVEPREEVLRKDALEEMFVASRKKFLAMAYSILRNREDAEDAVQEAFLSAYRHVRGFEGRSALKTWLTRIVLNSALMMKRKRKASAVRSRSENGASHDDAWTDSIPDSQPDPEMIHAERETLQFIDERLGKLKPLLRQAFTMAYFDELSGSEACARLGVSTGVFKARLFRAKRKVFDHTDRALVAPIPKRTLSASQFLKGR